MFKQLNLKKSLISLSQFSLGEHPTEYEVSCLQSLGLSISRPFSDADEHLLQTLHTLATRESTTGTTPIPYSRTGEWWKYKLGFQHTDPVSDIRGGGVLCLQNLIYFLSNHPKKTSQMIKARACRPVTQYAYPSFPWACAGINLTHMLAVEFEIIKPSGSSNLGIDAQYSNKTSWNYITAENGFNRMYVCLFLLLDYFWDEMNATYMEFNSVLKAVSDEFKLHLAISTSLTNLENRIHKRIDFIDPDVCDYTTLPDPDDVCAAPSSGSSYFGIEEGNFQAHDRNETNQFPEQSCIDNSLLAMFTNHMPSYDEMVSNLVPELVDTTIPNYSTPSLHLDEGQNVSLRSLSGHHHQPAPYCMQIV